MKNFWALPAALRVAIVLAAQHPFNPNDDLLAFPQYDIKWSDDYLTEALADSKLKSNAQRQSRPVGDATESHIERYRPPASSNEHSNEPQDVYFENMMLDNQRFLCSIPEVALLEDDNSGNDTLSKVEQEKELAEANTRGWDLLSGMQGNCVYYNSGWWSYSFCYNLGVRQFHQLTRGVPVYPPIEDPSIPAFMLGTYGEPDKGVKKGKGRNSVMQASKPSSGELVIKGDTRYLMQKLEGGTVCDLTGDPRRVEVQFHCNPTQGHDRISLIKELSTCSYLLIIHTPRLCNDVAFQPPQKDHPNEIVCQPVLKPDEIEPYEHDLAVIREALKETEKLFEEESTDIKGAPDFLQAPQLVGDVIVGGHNIVPKSLKLEKSAIVGGGKETYIATVASSDGTAMSKTEQEKLGLGSIDKLKKELEKVASGRGWKLDVVDTPHGRQYRGIIDDEDDDDKKADEDETEGSTEEFYKEEL